MDNPLPKVEAVVRDAIAERVQDLFEQFLSNYTDEATKTKFYLDQINVMIEEEKTSIYVDFAHISSYDHNLGNLIEQEYIRFEPYLRKGVQNMVRKHHPKYITDDNKVDKEFWLYFYGLPVYHKLRDLKTDKIGKLISVCGTVTRTTEVRPELLFGTFQCMDCQSIQRDIEQQFKYTEPIKCKNATCLNVSRWQLRTEYSKFVDWQKIRVQENANEIPSGSMPRSIDVILRHDAVERAKAGDRCVLTGMLIVVPDVSQIKLPGGAVTSLRERGNQQQFRGDGVQGLKQLGVRQLTYRLCFLACSVQSLNAKNGAVNIRNDDEEDDIVSQFTMEEREEILKMKQDTKLYQNFVNSMAPAVYGHEEVKRGILLMLFGGVHKQTPEGINLRGDINVCVVGDPSVAKSQFLKYVTSLVPRCVYTSGKASSAAGLTATVVRDSDTGEFNIEAGALMLADNGICCIDEFDKMDPADQVAIHEAMEQQTISIAKAGIQATLNARTSILAAANPIGGRYDKTKSIKANLMITPAIMSRFDLLFVVLDENDEQSDYNLARHIVSVHQKRDRAVKPVYTAAQVQRYIRFARLIKPKLTPDATDLLAKEFTRLRQNDAGGGSGTSHKTAWRVTVRQLESLVRLSEALARMHLDTQVKTKYVTEAVRLLRKSIIHIETDDVLLDQDEADVRADMSRLTAQFAADDAMDIDKENHNTINRGANKKRAGRKPAAKNKQAKEVGDDESVSEAARTVQSETSERRQVPVSYEKYKRITELLVLHLNRLQELSSETTGMKQGMLIDWYLKEHCGEIVGDEALMNERRVVRSVINKLVDKENVLLAVLQEKGVKDKDQRYLIVHPNKDLGLAVM